MDTITDATLDTDVTTEIPAAPQTLDVHRFPLHGARLIEASAGTGKTYTIAALYVRLVLGHGGAQGFAKCLMPPEILVVTFTNAATEELRERIRARLYEAARVFRGQSTSDPFLQGLLNDIPQEEWAARARQLDLAEQLMDEAAIFTIHGWCQRMLSQHAFDSGNLFNAELITDESDLLLETVRDYWRTFFYGLDDEARAQIIQLWKTPDALKSAVQPLLGQTLPDLPEPESVRAKRNEAVQAAKTVWAAGYEDAFALLEEGLAQKVLHGNKVRKKSLANWRQVIEAWLQNNTELPGNDSLCNRLTPAGLADALSKQAQDKGLTAPQHPAFEALATLQEQLAELPAFKSCQLGHAARWIDQRLKQEKQRRACWSFNDLLSGLDEALQGDGGSEAGEVKGEGGERLAQILREQYPVALIDEFQDTDPVQYRIFRRVYLDQPDTGFFMIGDPKQAIYAFRGADIFTYLQARHDTAGRHYTLGRNFRSTHGLVAAVNRLFSHADRHPNGAFLLSKDDIPFTAVDANGRKERLVIEDREAPALTLWQQDAGEAGAAVGKTDYLKAMAEATARQIARHLTLAQQNKAGFQHGDGLEPLKPSDIAVLVRNGREAGFVRDALQAVNVRSVYLSLKDSVFECAEAWDLLAWLRAVAEPEQERLLRAALATQSLGLPIQRLERLNQDELEWEAEVERFRSYREVWQRRGVLPMIRMLLRAFEVPERLYGQPGGERALTNLLHLSELLQSQSDRLDGEQGLIRWLEETLENAGSGEDEQILRLESDDALVQVVTIHKSKGLEYPLVYLPFICTYRPKDAKQPLSYHDAENRPVFTLEPDADAVDRAERERLAEDLRLLYVALTRPRHACWVGVAPLKVGNSKQCQLHQSGFGYLLSGGGKIKAEHLPELLQQLRDDEDDENGDKTPVVIEPVAGLLGGDAPAYQPQQTEDLTLAARDFNGKVERNWWIASYSGLLEGSQLIGSATAETEAPDLPEEVSAEFKLLQELRSEGDILASGDSIHAFPRGPRAGTFLHGLLEWIAEEGFAELADQPDVIEREVNRRCGRFFNSETDAERWAPVLNYWLQQLLARTLPLGPQQEPQAEVRLGELQPGRYQQELEFWLGADEVLTRAMDALIQQHELPGQDRAQLASQQLKGMLKGYIDLVFERDGRYYVLDYKSNALGDGPEAYSEGAMARAMLGHRYDLQYVLYTLALHRLLKVRLLDYDYERHCGGVCYLFLRGIEADSRGLYFARPSAALIEELDRLFAPQESQESEQPPQQMDLLASEGEG